MLNIPCELSMQVKYTMPNLIVMFVTAVCFLILLKQQLTIIYRSGGELDSGASGPGSSPGRGHCVVFLGKTLYSHSASLHPGV